MYQRKPEQLGWVQAAITAGTAVVGAVSQQKTIKGQIAQGKQGLALERERRATLSVEGQLQHDRDKARIMMLGIGGVAALGLAYFAFGKRRK
jgi:hypothetical protein